MAKAPDPLKLKAEREAEEARAAAEELRKAREALVLVIGRGDEQRVLRFQATTATMVGRLRREAKLRELELWGMLFEAPEPPLDALAVGWWLAGLQAGIDEPLDLDIDHETSAWRHLVDPEEADAIDGGGDDDPPG